jgi:hypothetical protein
MITPVCIKYFLFDSNLELIKELVIEVKADTLIEASDWKMKE